MAALLALLLLAAVLGNASFSRDEIEEEGGRSCGWLTNAAEAQRGSVFIDITHSIREDLPEFDSDKSIGKVVTQVQSIANGSMANVSEMKLGVHTGTHVDSPSHFLQDAFVAGVDTTNALDLAVLNGPVLVVEPPKNTNITAKVIEDFVPVGVKRVLFKTLNTDRRLMWKSRFVTDYVAMTPDAAEWIVHKTNTKLVGVDYLSIAVFDHLAETHKSLLRKGVVVVEGLNLDDVSPGLYVLHCLPTKLVGSDGAPVRCIIVKSW